MDDRLDSLLAAAGRTLAAGGGAQRAASWARSGATGAAALATAGVAGAAAAGAGRLLGRALSSLGATERETRLRLPGDGLAGDRSTVTTRAITIDAPRTEVWPWLVQLGWGRAGWYAIDALERPLGAARSVDADGEVSWRSLDEVVPAHQHLAVGDEVPLGPDLAFEVIALQAPEHLVLHLPTDWLTMTWTLALRRTGRNRTRLLARTRIAAPTTLGTVAVRSVLDPGHALMELVQLRGIRDRAEARVAERRADEV